MWTGSDPDKVKAAWADALGKYPHPAIADAVRAAPEAHPSWPPTLGEFCELVQACVPKEKWKPALPVPKRTAEELAHGAEQMAAIKAMLGKRITRATGASRVPGEDDEPLPAPASCTCWNGLVRSETLCESCAAFRRGLTRREIRADMARNGESEPPAEHKEAA